MTAFFRQDRARAYALLAFVTHCLVIGLSLIPGVRATPMIQGDATTYLVPAQNLLAHGSFSRETQAPYLWEPYRTPGYPLLIAASLRITGIPQWTLLMAACTAGMAAWAAVRLTQDLGCGRLAQHLAGGLVAFLPNSLGLSAQLLTDALVGHLLLCWVYAFYRYMDTGSFRFWRASVGILAALQLLKPTFFVFWIVIVIGGWLWLWGRFPLAAFQPAAGPVSIANAIRHVLRERKKQLIGVGLMAVFSLALPMFFTWRVGQAHGVWTANLLAVETEREYLQARYLAEQEQKPYAEIVREIRNQDRLDADKLTEPASFYGRLYLVKQAQVRAFFREHVTDALRLMASEAIRQALAPQEFVFQVFWGDLPAWGRALGSLLMLGLWLSAGLGSWLMFQKGEWRVVLFAWFLLGFFLAAGSLSHLVGARLRFPADMALIPVVAIGLAGCYEFSKKMVTGWIYRS
jgi:hypothetical protein